MNIANFNSVPAFLMRNGSSNATTTTTTTTTTTFNCANCQEYSYLNESGSTQTIFFYNCTTGLLDNFSVPNGESGFFCNCDSIGTPYASSGLVTITPTGNSC